MRWIIALLVCTLGVGLFFWSPTSAGEPNDAGVGPEGIFPRRIEVAKTNLVLNGHGLLEWGILNWDLYWGALYIERPSRDAGRILAGDRPARVHLHWVRDLKKKNLVKAWNAAFKANAGKDLARYEKRVARLNAMMRDVKKGECMRFTYLPKRGLEVRIGDDVRGTIEGADFARMFLRLYLGEKPPCEDLKRALLGIED